MTAPGPHLLGRSVVLTPGQAIPEPWESTARYVVDERSLADEKSLRVVVTELQRRYYRREPSVFVLAVAPESLAEREEISLDPFLLGLDFTFLRERLAKLVWHNSYDARTGSLVWWWAHKAAARFEVEVAGPADIVDRWGRAMWVDGGPRQPLDLPEPVVHHDSVDVGRLSVVPPRMSPSDELADDQLDAVTHDVGPARVIAPAGSGKTRVLTARFRHLVEERGYEPELVTALAYNRRAAGEMSERLPEGGGWDIRTIHSIGWEILRMARPGVNLIEEREQRRRLEPIAPAPPRVNTDVIGPYLEALDEVRIGLRHPDSVEAGRDDVPGFAAVFARYREGLLRRNEADHSEQIYGAVEALCRDRELRVYWQKRCRHLLVDEFQDLTPAYLLLIRLLASPGLDVFGVGDDDQVIYGYAGADPGFLIDFEEFFPGAGQYAVSFNYRCPRDVVASASTLLVYNRRRVDKTIKPWSTTDGLEVVRARGDDLATETVDRLHRLLDNEVAPSHIAVLTRVNSSLLPLHVFMADRGLPFRSPLSPALLDRTVVRGALAWIRVALEPSAMSRNDLFEAVRRPQRGITRLLGEQIGRRRGPFSLRDLIDLGADLEGRRSDRWNGFCEDIVTASRATDSTSRLLQVLCDDIGLEGAAAALDAGRTRADRAAQGDDLTALRRVAAFGPGPGDFESWLRARLNESGTRDGVTLSTVHRVKGLEWSHVLVFGVDRGAMPHVLSEDIEEERRIFHVAITRGRETVTVLSDSARPSRFLTELDGTAPQPGSVPDAGASRKVPLDDGIAVATGDQITVSGGYRGAVMEVLTTGVLISVEESGATMAIPWGERIEKSGSAGRLVPTASGFDTGLLERLKAWRLDQARSQGVPAYVVFNDSTLKALASLRPTTEAALLSVPGIGPTKLESYGDDLLDLLA